jgi:hypothetical protein
LNVGAAAAELLWDGILRNLFVQTTSAALLARARSVYYDHACGNVQSIENQNGLFASTRDRLPFL